MMCMWSRWWETFHEYQYHHKHELSGAILTLLITIITAAAALWWLRQYRKSTPPLPPGPAGLPLVGYLPFLGQNLHRDFSRLASLYGPIYKLWLGKKLCVVISSPSLLKQVVRDQDTVFANRDPVVSMTVASYGGNDIAFAPYGPVWKKLRKIFVGKMLSNNVVDNLYGLRRKAVKESVSRIYGAGIGTPVDVGSFAMLTAVNSVLTMLCGASSVKGEEGDAVNLAELRKASAELVVLFGKPNVSDLFPWLAWLDIQGIAKETRKVRRVFEVMIDSAIEKTKKAVKEKGTGGDESKDFVQFLFDLHEHGDDETSITMPQLKAMLMDIVVGGTDTTTTMVEWTMAELLKHPEAMRKVQEELTQVVGLTNMVEESHLSELTYLNAVVKETFRLHPPLPFLIPRCPSQSTTVGGYYIPKDFVTL
ncbi:Cytochrome P450, E-class, group I [Trema orientale]|uniref:Cytochrome P450, E-class, group I n=1 Tax=Trema orientale TaxID=63057 RepID=A0A2P5F556_TREOI|nr:Cytochrome P450, E-class, group I [Trema orientale]